MNAFKKAIDFLIQSNVIVALSAGALTKITLIKFGVDNELFPLLIVFGTVISYNYIRINQLKDERLSWYQTWFQKSKTAFIAVNLIAFAGVFVCSVLLELQLKALLILIPFLLITFFYVKPRFFKINSGHIRAIPFVKMLSICLSWAGVTTLFPLMHFNGYLAEMAWVDFFQRFLFVFALTIPFDIRDMHIDAKSLHTIPQVLGIKLSKILALTFLVLVLLLEYSFGNLWDFQGSKTIVFFMYLGVLIWKSSSDQPRFYTSFWVESAPILWLILILYF